jgi:type II secretory pathway component PulM
MSTQTPQTEDDALVDAIADSLAAAGTKVTRYPIADQAKVERLEAELSRLRALCEELRTACEEAATYCASDLCGTMEHELQELRRIQRILSAALKKAQKP